MQSINAIGTERKGVRADKSVKRFKGRRKDPVSCYLDLFATEDNEDEEDEEDDNELEGDFIDDDETIDNDLPDYAGVRVDCQSRTISQNLGKDRGSGRISIDELIERIDRRQRRRVTQQRVDSVRELDEDRVSQEYSSLQKVLQIVKAMEPPSIDKQGKRSTAREYVHTPMVYAHGDWVRPVRGLYAGDLALVWYPLLNGCPLEKQIPDYVTVLIQGRFPGAVSMSREPSGSGNASKKRKRSPLPRPTARRVEPEARREAERSSVEIYSNKKFFNGLLVKRFKANTVRHTIPRYAELQPFSDEGLDVRSWRRLLSQQSLRSGETVKVADGDFQSLTGRFVKAEDGYATVEIIGSKLGEGEGSVISAQIPLRSLDRHFEVGDNVRCNLLTENARFRSGIVINVKDWGDIDIDEYTELRRELIGSTVTRDVDAATNERNRANHGMKKYVDSLTKLQRPIPSQSQPHTHDIGNTASSSQPIMRLRPKDTFDSHAVRFIDITVVDLETNETFVTSHLELEFDDTIMSEATILPPQGFRTDQQAPMAVLQSADGNPLILRADPYWNAPASSEMAGRENYGFEHERRQGHQVLVFMGGHKGRWGQFIASNDTTALIHLEGSNLTVNIPLIFLYDGTANEFVKISEYSTIRLAYKMKDVGSSRTIPLVSTSAPRSQTPPPDFVGDPFAFPVLTPDISHADEDHWLLNPKIRELMERVNFHVLVDATVHMPPRVQPTSIRTMTSSEAQQAGLTPATHEVPCRYKRTRAEAGHQCIPIAAISAAQPRAGREGVIVKNPGQVRATNKDKRSWSTDLDGSELVGKSFSFVKTERSVRTDPNSGLIASLKLMEDIGDAPENTYIRVPVDSVCGVD